MVLTDKMVEFKNNQYYLIPDKEFCPYGTFKLLIYDWCFEQWGNPISSHLDGKWDHFNEGFVFKNESDKIEFILRWL